MTNAIASNVVASNFNGLSEANFLAQAERIVSNMTGNTAFPEPWPSAVPTLAQIQADLTAYQAALTATQAGDRTRVVERKSARSKLAGDLALLANSVQITAQGDPALLASTGFPLRQRAARTKSPVPPEPPSELRLVRGAVSGSIVVRASPVANAGGYDVQLTAADPTVDANWTDAGIFMNCGRIPLQGLTSLKTYSVRMRALGAAGFGGWSVPSSVLVL